MKTAVGIRMRYYLALFSPETWKAFNEAGCSVMGFRRAVEPRARRVVTRDRLICYVTKVSRWTGVLEVIHGPFIDHTPIFVPGTDPFIVRFRVKALVCLPLENAIAIYEDEVWDRLSFTSGRDRRSSGWTGPFRESLFPLSQEDGQFLETLLWKRAGSSSVKPSLPSAGRMELPPVPLDMVAESTVFDEALEPIEMQALVAIIGRRMGMGVWVPREDRGRVLRAGKGAIDELLDRLPLDYGDEVLAVLEGLDVVWLKAHAIKRAFGVGRSSLVRSALLRMADLLALRPNTRIKLHIVAPASEREDVRREMNRPVFALLPGRPLAQCCTFLSYEHLWKLATDPHLRYLSDEVLDKCAESLGAPLTGKGWY